MITGIAKMPVGLIFMKWNELAGNEILAKYPEQVDITERNLMQIFNTHDLTGEKGIISLMVGTINIISWYSGPESNFCVILLLSLDDDPDDYEEALIELSQIIFEHLEEKAYIELFPKLFKKITAYPFLTSEQKIALMYSNKIKRSILDRLRDEGVILKADLDNWLQEQYSQDYGDLDTILFDLIQKGLIEIISVKNERSLLIFLVKDIIMFKVPPFNLLNNSSESGLPDKLHKSYKIDIENYFKDYVISEEQNLRITEYLLNPDIYKIFNFLREGAKTKDNLMNLKEQGVEDFKSTLELLKKLKMIKTYIDGDGTEYNIIISDFFIDFYLPKYILKLLKTDYDNNLKSNEVLLKYLDLLESTHYSLKKKKGT